MMRRFRMRRPSASAIAAVVILLPVLGLVLLAGPFGGGGSSVSFCEDNVLTTSQVRAQKFGTPKQEVERRLGKGVGALEFGVQTGVAVEPMDATCTYYRTDQGNFYDVAQFCFRDDRLASRRIFLVPRS